jgi:hypothetical protein
VRFKRGDKKDNGFVFWSYTSWGGEWWITEDAFEEKNKSNKKKASIRYEQKMANISNDSKIKRGFENENGLIFWGYHHSAKNCELWLSKEEFKEKKNWKSEYNKKWSEENKDRLNFLKRKWEKNNPEKHKASQIAIRLNRRARKKENGGVVTKSEIKNLKIKSKNVCFYCKSNKKLSIDHVIPLKLGGRNEISNMVIACINCNSKKQAKDPITYAREIGRLLI